MIYAKKKRQRWDRGLQKERGTERKDITAKKEQREISELKSQIAHKDSVIAELADANMGFKKSLP